MQLDPILVLRDAPGKDVIVLSTFDEVRCYVGADRPGPKMGVVHRLSKAECAETKRIAVEEFKRWAHLTDLLVRMVPAEQPGPSIKVAEQ